MTEQEARHQALHAATQGASRTAEDVVGHARNVGDPGGGGRGRRYIAPRVRDLRDARREMTKARDNADACLAFLDEALRLVDK